MWSVAAGSNPRSSLPQTGADEPSSVNCATVIPLSHRKSPPNGGILDASWTRFCPSVPEVFFEKIFSYTGRARVTERVFLFLYKNRHGAQPFDQLRAPVSGLGFL